MCPARQFVVNYKESGFCVFHLLPFDESRIRYVQFPISFILSTVQFGSCKTRCEELFRNSSRGYHKEKKAHCVIVHVNESAETSACAGASIKAGTELSRVATQLHDQSFN